MNNQGIQNEITTVIEKDPTLKGETTQLSNITCDCTKNPGSTNWYFLVICAILTILIYVLTFLYFIINLSDFLYYLLQITASLYYDIFHCWPEN
jgi:hypothetical protein